jgi:hypothetical protein
MNIRRTYEGDIDTAERASHEADCCMRKTQEIKNRLGISYINKSYALAGGEMVHVIVTQDTSYVHTIAPFKGNFDSRRHRPETMATIAFGVPDYVSGAVLSPIIDELPKEVDTGRDKSAALDDPDAEEHVMVEIIRDKIRNLKLVEKHEGRHTVDQAKEKLAVLPAPGHEGTQSPFDENKYSQYRTLTPGYFTGFMRTVVQLMAGIGKVIIVDDTDNGRYAETDTLEKRWLRDNPTKKLDFAEYALDGESEPPYRKDFPYKLYTIPKKTVEVAVPFFAASYRTHGVGWDTAGRAYVIEIGMRGCYAIPFPLDPYSLTKKGRARYLELMPELAEEDEYGFSVFGSLGGFPAIDCMPGATKILEQYVRAGEATMFLSDEDMDPFYRNSAYSTAVCWAFKPSGGRADNTCYGYPDGSKTAVGYHYAVTFAIASRAEPEEAAAARSLIGLLNLEGFEARKALRLDETQLEDLFKIEDKEDMYDAFDDLQVSAPFLAKGSLKLIKKGNLYHHGALIPKQCYQFSVQPQIKFPEPVAGAILSFDFGPIAYITQAERPKCDTPMYVIYKSDSTLYTLNYYHDPNPPAPSPPEDDRAECQYTGTWTNTSAEYKPRAVGNFYSSQWDARKELTGGGSVTRTTGDIIAHTVWTGPSCVVFWAHAMSYTEVWGTQHVESDYVGAHDYRAAVAIPLNDRSIFYMCTYEQKLSNYHTEAFSGPINYGPGGTMALNVAVFNGHAHFYNFCTIEDFWGLELGCKLHEYTDPTPIETCFAGSPDPVCPDYDVCGIDGKVVGYLDGLFGYSNFDPNKAYHRAWRTGTAPSGSSWSTSTKPTAVVEYKVRIFGDTEIDGLYTYDGRLEGEDSAPEYEGQLVNFYSTPLSSRWFQPSPDGCGNLAYMFVNRNHWGSNLIVYDPQINALNTKFYGTPEEMNTYINAVYTGHIV